MAAEAGGESPGVRVCGDGIAVLDDAAVYGLPELHADAIKQAALLANPGCYSTSIILALAPWIRAGLVDLQHGIICDAKSGVSGAGKQPTPTTHFVEVDGDFSAYNVFGHRHTGEMLEQLGLGEQHAAIHAASAADSARHSVHHLREAGEACNRRRIGTVAARVLRRQALGARLRGRTLPQIKFSVNTNYCDIGFALSPDGQRAVLVSCLDNLLKGAAGQAVQNMDLMFGFDEKEGLQ